MPHHEHTWVDENIVKDGWANILVLIGGMLIYSLFPNSGGFLAFTMYFLVWMFIRDMHFIKAYRKPYNEDLKNSLALLADGIVNPDPMQRLNDNIIEAAVLEEKKEVISHYWDTVTLAVVLFIMCIAMISSEETQSYLVEYGNFIRFF